VFSLHERRVPPAAFCMRREPIGEAYEFVGVFPS
jgi:hypothetical protein